MFGYRTLRTALLEACEKIYRPPGAALGGLKIGEAEEDVLAFARQNRLAQHLALELRAAEPDGRGAQPPWTDLVREYEDYRHRLREGVASIAQTLSLQSFIVIKTVSSFPQLTHDLDVVVKDLGRASRVGNREFFPDGPTHLSTDEEADAKAGRLQIHVGTDISWTGLKAVSDEFAWKNTERMELDGIEILVPNPAFDVLLRVGHMVFETGHIKLGELLHIYRQSSDFSWDLLNQEARTMGWPLTFGKMSARLDRLHQGLFGRPGPGRGDSRPSTARSKRCTFPCELSLGLLATGVAEKQAWRKIPGARYVVKDKVLRWLGKSIG